MDEHQAVLQFVGSGFFVWAALVATASVVVHLRVPWWRSQMGRHLMAYMAAMAVVLDLGVIKLIIGDSWGFQLLRLITFVGVPLVMSWRLWLQIQAQRVGCGDTVPTPGRTVTLAPPPRRHTEAGEP